MKVATLSKERSSLVSVAASRSLMLERHERAAELFSKITRLRRELSSYVEDQPDPKVMEESSLTEVNEIIFCYGQIDSTEVTNDVMVKCYQYKFSTDSLSHWCDCYVNLVH